MKFCKVEGCGRKHFGNGYCQNHNRQIKIYGEFAKLNDIPDDPIDHINNAHLNEIPT